MSCQRTGFNAYIEPLDMWAYGDAYELRGVTYFRICKVRMHPLRDRKHYTIHDWYHWFDERKTSQAQNSTMICGPEDCTYHGYEGVPL